MGRAAKPNLLQVLPRLLGSFVKEMASTASCCKAFNGGPSLNLSPSPIPKAYSPVNFIPLPCIKFFSPLEFKSRRFISQRKRIKSEHLLGLPIISCLPEEGSGVYSELRGSSGSSDSPKGASIDIKLPRRSLLVTFTCNACGARSKKFVNRLAYERGTVFAQCSGCFQHHKLVDNLGLVVEYNFKEESSDPNANQQ